MENRVETLSKEEKTKILKALETDLEFRYAVMAALGYKEILDRLDRHEEHIKNILQEIKSLREEQIKIWEEIRSLRKEQISLRQEVAEISRKIDMLNRSLERLTLSLEEEAIDVIKHRLSDDLGISIDLVSIVVDKKEIDIYGVSDDLCVIGEATVRLGKSLVERLERIIEYIRDRRPGLLRKRLIKVIYTFYATEDAKKLAIEKGVWIVRARGDITPRVIHEIR
jgi:septation ring formation regulator EzrA